MADDFFAPPAFNAEAALVQLKRQLRALRPLSERGAGFDYKGQAVVKLALDGQQRLVDVAKRPARSPEWDRHTLRSSPDVRRLLEALTARLARWDRDD